jgi:para-nitrobenzyl esterase
VKYSIGSARGAASVFRRVRRYRLASGVGAFVLVAAATTAGVQVASAAPAQAGCAAGTTVSTASGEVCGIAVSGVDEWLGIPYAAAPVGALRWQPPQPHAPWTSTLQATAYGSECIQPTSLTAPTPTAGSENCLFVNVWKPAGASASGGLPVMVHIHGGGFRTGSGDSDNTLLATTGHEVIVSMNYRLGIFGFLADSALGHHSGDYGLQDQQAAMRWVRQNIAAFGGNPHRVTIFGESAGGSSVCDQIDSPTAAGLFQRAISTSGEYGGLFGVPGPAFALENQDCKATLPSQAHADSFGSGFASAAGCTGSSASVKTCLQQLPADEVSSVAGNGYQYGGHGTIAPTINGKTLTMSLRQALKTGHVNRVQVIAGTDRDENLIALPTTAAQYRAAVRQQYGRYASAVLALYPLSHFDSPFVAFRTVAADSDTVCPALITDQDLARWMPVYGYEIDNGDAPPASFEPAGEPNGSYHVASWYLNPVSPALDPNQQVLQNQEVADVTTFARTGNPSAKGTPVWPLFNATHLVMSLEPGGDSQIMTVAQMRLDHNCGFWDRIAPKS